MTEHDSSPPVRIALLNDYDLVVAGLATMLQPFDEVQVVDMSAGAVDLEAHVDVALYDTYGRSALPWPETGALTRHPRARYTALFVFGYDQHLVQQAFAAGVNAVLWKGLRAPDLVASLRRVADGERVVTPRDEAVQEPDPSYRWPFAELGLSMRESEVLALVAKGLTNRAIARQLYLGEQTIKSHLRQVYRKLDVHSRAEATAKALTASSFHHAVPRT